jgi:hypothetical protein
MRLLGYCLLTNYRHRLFPGFCGFPSVVAPPQSVHLRIKLSRFSPPNLLSCAAAAPIGAL